MVVEAAQRRRKWPHHTACARTPFELRVGDRFWGQNRPAPCLLRQLDSRSCHEVPGLHAALAVADRRS